ncbi:MAG: Gfo/Idh/MocA family oxidoreductase [Actinomycetota bacterium]
MRRLRWGIVSTADIGMTRVIPAIQRAEGCEVVAIASRSLERAAAAATRFAIPAAYGSYQQLLERDEVEAVYIPLPNDAHAPWTIRAAQAGKHVLCEKPLALTVAQAEEMGAACRQAGVKLAEAFMYRHHPSWVETVRLVRTGAIGELQAVQSFFGFYNDDPDDIRNSPEAGGGALMDVGCYCVDLSRMLFDAEPTGVTATVRRDPDMGIDVMTSALLEFPGGGQASFACGIRVEPDQRVHLLGTKGRIEIEIPFNIPPDRETRIFVTSGGDPPVAPATRTIGFGPVDQYSLQATAFARAVLDDAEVTLPVENAVANLRVIERILRS